MLRKLINKILSMMGKPPPEEYYQYTDCVGFWIDSCYDYEDDEYDDDEDY